MKRVIFDETSTTEDWRYSYQLLTPHQSVWSPDTWVVLGMNPAYTVWDDYGIKSRASPPADPYSPAPWFQASSRDGSGIVVLRDPNIIDIIVPWNHVRSMGPGSVAVTLSLRTDVPPSRTTLLQGQLPLYDGVV